MRLAGLSFLILLAIKSPCQEKIRTITLKDTIVLAAIDRPGDLYVVTHSGEIRKHDKNGDPVHIYNAGRVPALFDPRDGARLFVYYRNDQRCEYLSPSLETMRTRDVDPSFAIQPWLVCPSGEHKLWILDSADNSLKKADLQSSQVEIEVSVDPSLIDDAGNITAMRDYQTFLFLLDPRKGILIFNGLGKYLRTLDLPGIRAFNFLGGDLYWLDGNRIGFFNLFTTETRDVAVPPGYTQVLLTDERMMLISSRQIDIFPFRP